MMRRGTQNPYEVIDYETPFDETVINCIGCGSLSDRQYGPGSRSRFSAPGFA